MNAQDKYPDGPPLMFPGGQVDTSRMRASHNGSTPTTLSASDAKYYLGMQGVTRNTKLTRPAEQYPGEAERMIAEMTRGAISSIQRARDATDPVRLRVELEEAAWFIAQARRWATP